MQQELATSPNIEVAQNSAVINPYALAELVAGRQNPLERDS